MKKLITLIALLSCIGVVKAQNKPDSIKTNGLCLSCLTGTSSGTLNGNGWVIGSKLTIYKPEKASMNINYADKDGIIRIDIDPKQIEKRIIWLNDSTLILLKKIK